MRFRKQVLLLTSFHFSLLPTSVLKVHILASFWILETCPVALESVLFPSACIILYGFKVPKKGLQNCLGDPNAILPNSGGRTETEASSNFMCCVHLNLQNVGPMIPSLLLPPAQLRGMPRFPQ